jgi:hypothetical protein
MISGKVEGLTIPEAGFAWVGIKPGDVFHVPSGAQHAFRNRGPAPAIMTLISTSRIGRFFQEVGTPIPPGAPPGPPTPEVMRRFLETSPAVWLLERHATRGECPGRHQLSRCLIGVVYSAAKSNLNRMQGLRARRAQGAIGMRRRIGLLSMLVALSVFLPRAAMAQESTSAPQTVAPARTDMRYVLPFGPDGLNPALP